jgi:hypothetical protein
MSDHNGVEERHVNDRRTAALAAVGAALFIILEMVRQITVAAPPEGASIAEVAAYVREHHAVLQLFPWLDAIAAGGFLVFAIILLGRLSRRENRELAAIGGAAATLVFGVSLALDAMVGAWTILADSATPELTPAVVAAAHGVEAMFAYPLGLFLGMAAVLQWTAASRTLGVVAGLLGLGFLASELAAGLGRDLAVEGPLFMVFLLWIAAGSITMIRASGVTTVTSPAAVAAD